MACVHKPQAPAKLKYIYIYSEQCNLEPIPSHNTTELEVGI